MEPSFCPVHCVKNLEHSVTWKSQLYYYLQNLINLAVIIFLVISLHISNTFQVLPIFPIAIFPYISSIQMSVFIESSHHQSLCPVNCFQNLEYFVSWQVSLNRLYLQNLIIAVMIFLIIKLCLYATINSFQVDIPHTQLYFLIYMNYELELMFD